MRYNEELKSWLRFNTSPTDDYFGNPWTAVGTPSVSATDAEYGNTLQLDGSGYIKNTSILPAGGSFTIDFWLKCPDTIPSSYDGYILCVYNPVTAKMVTGLYYYDGKVCFFFNYANGNAAIQYNDVAISGLSHIAIVYKQGTGTNDSAAYLFVNGERITYSTQVTPQTKNLIEIYIGARYNGTRYGTGTAVDELRIYSGVARWIDLSNYTAFTPPLSSEYAGMIFPFSMQRKIMSKASQWYYTNPGRAELLTTANGTTVTGLTGEKSTTGVGFYQPDRMACFGISATKEIWIRCDVYTTANYANNDRLRIYSQDSNGVNGWATNATITNYSGLWHNNIGENATNVGGNFAKNRNRSILLHMKSGSSGGLIEISLKNITTGVIYTDTFSGNVNAGNDFANVYIQMDGSNIYVSNLIISDEPITMEDSFISSVLDTQREIVKGVSLSLDTERQIVAATIQQDFYVDAQRQLTKSVMLALDAERNISAPISLSCDAERILANLIDVSVTVDAQRILSDDEIWRYENVGLLNDLRNLPTYDGTGEVHGLPATKSSTGVAFYTNQETKGIFPIPTSSRLWVKFDVYRESGEDTQWSLRDQYYRAPATAITTNWWDVDDIDVTNPVGSGTSIIATLEDVSNPDGLQTVIVHLEADATDGLIEVYTDDGGLIYSYMGQVHLGMPFANLTLCAPGNQEMGTVLFSNVVISNGALDFDDNAHWSDLDVALTVDAERDISQHLTVNADVERIVCDNSITTILACDTARILDYYANTITETFDAERKLATTISFVVDTLRVLPHQIAAGFTVGLASVSVSITEQQLTDKISLSYSGDIDILDGVRLTLLDYNINGRVEEMSKRGIISNCSLMTNIDEILYQQMAYEIPESEWEFTEEFLDFIHANRGKVPSDPGYEDADLKAEPFAAASTHITKIAESLGLNVSLHFGDFISTMSTKVKSGTNYAGLIEELFGWTSRLPQMMINVYLRGNTLHVVQRGYEQNTVSLDNQKLTVHTINKKLMRTTWGSEPWSETEVRPYYHSWDEGVKTPLNDDGSGATFDSDGLIEHNTITKGNEVVEIEYIYTMREKGQKYLSKEIATHYVDGVEVDTQIVTHDPVRDTQAHIYVTDDSGVVSSTVTSSNNDDRITPFQEANSSFQGALTVTDSKGDRYLLWRIYHHTDEIDMKKRTIYGVALIDTSFPVDGQDKLEELTQKIIWLDRKVEESVTLDIYDYPHVIDFNDKIVWNGHTYYLRSNTATKTDSIVNKQSLTFVRWY